MTNTVLEDYNSHHYIIHHCAMYEYLNEGLKFTTLYSQNDFEVFLSRLAKAMWRLYSISVYDASSYWHGTLIKTFEFNSCSLSPDEHNWYLRVFNELKVSANSNWLYKADVNYPQIPVLEINR